MAIGGGINWASMNPFAKADRGEITPPNPDPKTNQVIKSDVVPDDPNNPKLKNKPEGEDDPLLKFDDLWQPNKDKDGKVIEDTNSQPSSYLPQIDPKKLGEMVNKMDFTKSFTSEEVEAIKAGGDNAVAALASMMNKASRQAFQVSLAAATKLAEQGVANAHQRFISDIPEHVRNHMLENDLGSDPIFKNPALQPIVKSVKDQYLKKFPKATPAELNNAVKQYFNYVGTELNKKPEDKTNTSDKNSSKLRQGDPTADFEEWLGKEVLQSRGAFGDDSGATGDNQT